MRDSLIIAVESATETPSPSLTLGWRGFLEHLRIEPDYPGGTFRMIPQVHGILRRVADAGLPYYRSRKRY